MESVQREEAELKAEREKIQSETAELKKVPLSHMHACLAITPITAL